MIHIAVGTKAQFIKVFPLIQVLENENVEFNFVNLGQHYGIVQSLFKEFGFKPSLFAELSMRGNTETLGQGIFWLAKMTTKSLNRRWLKTHVFKGKGGICIIHGDTASTLVGLFMAKMAGLKVAHLEAGLRSFNLLEPFPEEIIRLLAMRFSDVLFAPSQWSYENLLKMKLSKKARLLSGNTSFEAFKTGLKSVSLPENIPPKFSLASIHRIENIFSVRRLQIAVGAVLKAADYMDVVFVQHPPTLKSLQRFNLQAKLEQAKRVKILPLLGHNYFLGLLQRCEFVMTDGGSIQEEAYYLGKPCLLLRKNTERREGVGENVYLSYMDESKIKWFMENYRAFIKNPASSCHPAEEIVSFLKQERFI